MELKKLVKSGILILGEVSVATIRKWIERVLKTFDYYLLSIDDINNYLIKEEYILEYVDKDKLSFDYIILSEITIIERIKYINYVINAFNKLTKEERMIIYYLYIDKTKITTELICEKLNISLSKYFRDKNVAITRFAYALGMEDN